MANSNENLHFLMDDSPSMYAEICKKKYKRTLEDDLEFIQFVNDHDDLELDPNSNVAKLEREITKCGLEITPDTDIKQLAATVRLLGIV